MALPTDVDRKLRAAINDHGLSDVADQIRRYARLTFLMRVDPLRDPGDAPMGRSRLGGTPDLPPGEVWPQSTDGRSPGALPFLAQINLSELPDCGHPLPRSGMLYVYSVQESTRENQHLVRAWTGSLGDLERQPVPDEIADEDDVAGSLVVREFIPSVSLDTWSLEHFLADEAVERVWQLGTELDRIQGQKEPASRLLGYPSGEIQNADADEEVLVELQSFFQDGTCYMNFWDAGSQTILVPTSGLPTCRFTRSRSLIVTH